MTLMKSFQAVWESLFTSPVHLDSALSKQPKNFKGALAKSLYWILLRPVSLAEALGIGIPSGEPWSLTPRQLVSWRPAKLIAQYLDSKHFEFDFSRLDPGLLFQDFPPQMIAEWEKDWGSEICTELTSALSQLAPLGIRVTRRVGPHSVLKEWISQNPHQKMFMSEISPFGLRLNQYTPVMHLESYRNGAFEIQDEGSQFMSLFVLWPQLVGVNLKDHPSCVMKTTFLDQMPQLRSDLRVVDACAGAGGKSLAMADALGGKGRVFAYDISDRKLLGLRKRAKKAGLNNIQTIKICNGKESEAIRSFEKTANRVLVDAPCTGWGVLRRNPDLKWRQRPDELKVLPEIQYRLLSQYSKLVAPGGSLVFGVCTFRRMETLDLVSQFTEKNPLFDSQKGGYLGPGPCDGFFMHQWVRKF